MLGLFLMNGMLFYLTVFVIKIKSGEINFNKIQINKYETYQRVGVGISHVLERRRVFPYLTVLQNLLLGAYHEKAKTERD